MTTVPDQERLLSWRDSIEQFSIGDIRKCLNYDLLEVGLVILSLISIDSLSGYFAGQPAARETFVAFVSSRYFPDSYGSVAQDLFDLRNGLVHDYAIKRHRFVLFGRQNEGPPHLAITPHPDGSYIALNREILAHDVLNMWTLFSQDALTDSQLQTNILKRLTDTTRGYLVVIPKPVPVIPSDPKQYRLHTIDGGTVTMPSSATSSTETLPGGTVSWPDPRHKR